MLRCFSYVPWSLNLKSQSLLVCFAPCPWRQCQMKNNIRDFLDTTSICFITNNTLYFIVSSSYNLVYKSKGFILFYFYLILNLYLASLLSFIYYINNMISMLCYMQFFNNNLVFWHCCLHNNRYTIVWLNSILSY